MKKPFVIIASIFVGIIMLRMFLSIASLAIRINSSFSILMILMFILIICSVIIPIAKGAKKYSKQKMYLENIPTEFEEIYQRLYEEHIYNLEGIRKKVKLITVFQSIAFILFFTQNIHGNFGFAILMFFTAIALIFISSKHIKEYKRIYKEEIVATFIKSINSKLEYRQTSNEFEVMESDYKRANFDNNWFNRFYPDDYIEGYLDEDVFVKMGNLHIQKHTGSGKNSKTVEIFNGIFAHMRCGKDIGTSIKISKNQLKIFEQYNRVEMDSQEFEKYFDIYSENKILTMQLLTSDVMATLVDFYNKYYIDYEIVIRNNKIYMRFFTGSMFEPKIFGNSMDKKLLFSYFCILKFIVDVTKEVNKALKEVET